MHLFGIKPLLTAFIALLHPFYVSVIEIEHNAKESTMEISVRTFTPDLEERIEKELNIKLDLGDPKQKTKAEEAIHKYVQKKLGVTVNGMKGKLDFIGYEIQKESTWSYYEIKNVKDCKKVLIFCEILFGIDPQQINIIHLKANGQRKSFELAAPKNTTEFNF
jgi:hypothetical protein